MKNDNPIISVIVPVYNTEQYLRICLDSLCVQPIDNMEILVIDDASEQDIQAVANHYQSIYQTPQILYVRNSCKRAPGGARNVGLKLARGKYIGFCDSDDWVDYNFYSTAVRYMEKAGADIGMCSQKREYDAQPTEPIYKCKYDEFLTISNDIVFRTMSYQYQTGIKVIPPCTNKIYKRSFLTRLQASFVENMYFQDVLFSVQTILNAHKIICIPKVEYHHYKRSNSIIQSFDQQHIHDFVRLFTLIKEYLKEKRLYSLYSFNYYKMLEHFMNIIIREIFEFLQDDELRKSYIVETLSGMKSLVKFEEYMEYCTAEDLRRHIQPNIHDTTLY